MSLEDDESAGALQVTDLTTAMSGQDAELPLHPQEKKKQKTLGSLFLDCKEVRYTECTWEKQRVCWILQW